MSSGNSAAIENRISGAGQTDDLETAANITAAGEKMVASVGRVEAVLNCANQDASAYNQALADFGGEISQGSSDEMKALVARMTQQTMDMQRQNNVLRAQLENSSDEIEKLRCNLEEVQNDAMTDGLTRVGNRKCFDLRLSQMAEEALRDRRVFASCCSTWIISRLSMTPTANPWAIRFCGWWRAPCRKA